MASRFNVDLYNETKIETGIGMLPQHNLLASARSGSPNQRKNILPVVVHASLQQLIMMTVHSAVVHVEHAFMRSSTLFSI